MRKIRKILALLLALACLCALFACGKPADPADDEEPTPDVSAEDAAAVQASASVTCCDGDITLRFTKNEMDKWIWKEDSAFPLDETYVTELMATIEQMLALTPLENPEAAEEYGLDGEEEKYVSVSGREGQILWYLGDQDSSDCYYMRRSDQEGLIYLAPAQLTEQISRSIYDMALLPALPQLTAENLTSLTITDEQEQQTVIRRNSQGNWVDNLGVNRTLAVEALLHAYANPAISACIDFRPASGVPSICGLKTPQVTMTAEYINSLNVQATLTLKLGKEWLDGYYMKMNDDTTIYLLSAELAKPVLAFVA